MPSSLRFTAPDGASLAYQDEGQGLPVLCLSGLTRTMADFDYVAPHLTGCRVIRMDYRGRGESDWTGPQTYNVPTEAGDALALMDHLGLQQAAVLGTSRGGINGMYLAATAKARLLGLCLNDIGPVIHRPGLERIRDYIGRRPAAKTHAEAAAKMPHVMEGFANVPASRWLQEVQHFYDETPSGLQLKYDAALREPFLEGLSQPPADLWPMFEACTGLPLALIRGENSDLLTPEATAEMQARCPDMILAGVPDRAHVPFLDEPQSLMAIGKWLERLR
ncbi:alpha/beta hydrolase [Xinfangfangia sp. CPCC 101601]|uniref:Alpha/beta hydrolase n=1 Tax=Pseudogemmobacter lacusdianii TaxID=3069608 RepID=A0ABU0VT06_9RHOB|nr:alpha/beta hydrolase [Xinfangfangia sp. CPCC 101601]MDQ2064849.1 alpha/beta hydrolase [Xinfangfangia sp. CPCC 101601]